MLIIALLCAIAVAGLHYYIAYLQLPEYGNETFCRVFQISVEDLPKLKTTFNNLAIYNFAQAAWITLGILLHAFANSNYLYGMANGVLFAGLGTACAAGTYLYISTTNKRKVAMIQTIPALLGIICLACVRF